VVARTRRKDGDSCARIEFGPRNTDKSRRTLEFPPFVAALLAEQCINGLGTTPGFRGSRINFPPWSGLWLEAER
jgi:hypothetical protein